MEWKKYRAKMERERGYWSRVRNKGKTDWECERESRVKVINEGEISAKNGEREKAGKK